MLRDSPYQGLRPFAEEDADFFFGRENETRIISANFRTRRLTLLYGPSGVGKSSVLQAGVIHHLYQLNARLALEDLDPDDGSKRRQRVEAGSETSKESSLSESTRAIVVVTFESWIADPHDLLKDAILAALEKSFPKIFTASRNQELRQLGLHDMLLNIMQCPEVRELLIILDQFEKYLVYNSFAEKPDDFAAEFCRAVSSRKLRANFLVSIREDWLAGLDRFSGRVPNFFDNSIRLEHMDRESAKSAIKNPILKYNERLGEQPEQPGVDRRKVIIEEPFIDEALDQLEQLDLEREGSEHLGASTELKTKKGRIEAAGLQIVLQRLWNDVENDATPKLTKRLLPAGAARRIFRSHLDESLAHLSPTEKSLAEKLFPLLVSSSGIKLPDTAKSLAERSGSQPGAVQSLLTKLTQAKILNEHGPLNSRVRLPFYETASDVIADELRNWVAARRLRHRRLSRGAKLVLVLIGFIAGTFGLTQYSHNRDNARVEQQRLERELYLRSLDTVRRSSAEKDKQVAFLKITLRGHVGNVTSAVFTSDGQVLTASADGSAILWDPETGDPVRLFAGDDAKPIVCAAISPDGNLIITANTDGTVLVWGRSLSGVPLQLRGHVGKHVTSISFSPKGDLIAAANTNGDLLIWNSNTLELIANKAGNGKPVHQISFSPSGKLLATASEDLTARVWEVGVWSDPKVLAGHSAQVNGLAFSPDEQSLATASADATVRVWVLQDRQPPVVFTGHNASVNSVDFDPSGQRLLSASDDQTACIWDLKAKTHIVLKGHTDKVLSASFSPNGLQVATGSRDTTARIWSATSGQPLVELRDHKAQVGYVSYSKDGKYVLTASDDATAKIWLAPESEPFQIDTPVIKAKWSDGPCPVLVSFDVSITPHSGTGSVIYRFKGSDGRIWPTQELVFDNPDTQYLKWYWRITESTSGSQTIEIIEPKGITEQSAKFKITCNGNSASPAPATTSKPAATGAASPASPASAPTASLVPSPL